MLTRSTPNLCSARYLQIDSWFYKKGHKNGTRTWAPEKNIFPNGFANLYAKTGLPIGYHNRYWDNDTTYARYNGGKYNFISDSTTGCAVPDDQVESHKDMPYVHALVATFSTGPVGPGDGIGYVNSSLLMKCCNSDGLILRASRPLTIMDKSLKQAAFVGGNPTGLGEALYSTIANISGHIFGTILATEVNGSYNLEPIDLTPDYPGECEDVTTFIYNSFTGKFRAWSSSLPFTVDATTCGTELCVFYSTSLIRVDTENTHVGLLGEMNAKFSPVSPQRFFAIRTSGTGEFEVKVRMSAGENIDVWFLALLKGSSFTLFLECDNSHSTKPTLVGLKVSQGDDHFGRWNKTTFSYLAGTLSVQTSVKVYMESSLPVAVFSQTFSSAAHKTKGKVRDDIISSFPSVRFPSNDSASLGYLAYGDFMAGWIGLSIGRWTKSEANFTTGIKGGPLVLFDKSSNALVISPLSNFMAASNKKFGDKHVSWGIMGLVDDVPADYNIDFIIYFSNKGVNEAMRGWGSYLTTLYGKTDRARERDLSLTHLGYWTDNGEVDLLSE
ncbi:non-lysosomal glucosylceramidase [Plakobranchus ocellatus]|uniref:Non-lysosomal glucosylceramidase n=1 Tax=Plakobranchus ocellatus TaxID=259542 RepID=A0AAV4D6B7_9GAST|nr:non-lysosomal glucosylceramidase [Plakobranchus ocellatus]